MIEDNLNCQELACVLRSMALDFVRSLVDVVQTCPKYPSIHDDLAAAAQCAWSALDEIAGQLDGPRPGIGREYLDEMARRLLAGGLNECRVCRCTEADCSGCVARTGQACYWVEPDLCSACAPLELAGPPLNDLPAPATSEGPAQAGRGGGASHDQAERVDVSTAGGAPAGCPTELKAMSSLFGLVPYKGGEWRPR